MDNRPPSELAADVTAALDWWREAGVDCGFTDQPVSWIGPSEADEANAAAPPARAAALAARAEAPIAQPIIERSDLPTDLAAFVSWWLSEPALDQGRVGDRVPPRGAAGAEFMIIVPEPETGDRERLLTGPQARLLEAMFAAMKIAPEQAYIASALPRHTPLADWQGDVARDMSVVLAHHIRLVGPRRLLVFGTDILPLLGHDPAKSPAVSPEFNHEELSMPLFAARSLAALIERPRWKAGVWKRWLDWTGGGPSEQAFLGVKTS